MESILEKSNVILENLRCEKEILQLEINTMRSLRAGKRLDIAIAAGHRERTLRKELEKVEAAIAKEEGK